MIVRNRIFPPVIGFAAVVWIGGAAKAQVRILPRASVPATAERYLLQIANDHQQPITRVELRFPRSVRITSIGERSDWAAQSYQPGAGVSAAVWSGSLSPGRYTEFGFIGVNPTTPVTLVWPVIVTYADGEQELWWTGKIAHKAPTTVIATAKSSGNGMTVAFTVCVIAFVLAVVAFAIAFRSGSASLFQREPG